jgi:hypothetical protein
LRGHLYLNVPLWGRVKLTTLSGSLWYSIPQEINVSVAKGNVKLYLANGKEVQIHIALDIKSAGNITWDMKLFTLPYVSVLFLCVGDLNITFDMNAGSMNDCDVA